MDGGDPMNYVSAFLAALICALILTPVVIRIAYFLRVLDLPNPNNPGKIHKRPIALMGGLVIYLAVLVAGGLSLQWSLEIVGIFLAVTVVLLLGLSDDLWRLDYRTRLAIQILAAAFLVFGLDIKIDFLADLPLLCYPLTLLWIVGVTNALNLMDNVDGATSGVSFFAAIGLFIVSAHTGHTVVATLSLALAGACLGFLPYNFKPASIFLGDMGTLMLGFLFATLSILSTESVPPSWNYALIFPLLLGVPIYDTGLATSIRLYRRRPIYLADRSNLTYRLFDVGLTQIQTVIVEYMMAFCFLASALMVMVAPPLLGVMIVLGTAAGLVLLGFHFVRTTASTTVTATAMAPSQPEYTLPLDLKLSNRFSVMTSKSLRGTRKGFNDYMALTRAVDVIRCWGSRGRGKATKTTTPSAVDAVDGRQSAHPRLAGGKTYVQASGGTAVTRSRST